MDGRVVLIGGGGHALVVAETARRAGLALGGFVDDLPDAVLSDGPGALQRLGEMQAWRSIERAVVHLAIGDLEARQRVLEELGDVGTARIVDPSAVISESARIDAGAFVAAGVVVQARATVGAHTIVNTGAIIEHECKVEANVHIAPGAVLAGRVQVGSGTLIGLGARVLPGVRVGCRCVIGAGAVVTGDVADGGTVVGLPARLLRAV